MLMFTVAHNMHCLICSTENKTKCFQVLGRRITLLK
uniref:Uncharacterized protein n=1 Tax=Anguilla anguilla TaxID=7936 RepID=A0A0E9TTZ6_ANGAN